MCLARITEQHPAAWHSGTVPESRLFHSPEGIADRVRAWVAAAELPDAAHRIRVRLKPSPLPPRETVKVDVEGDRTADALHDALIARLAGLELAPRVRVRVEVLDGAGASIPGAGDSFTTERPAPPREDPPMPQPPTAHPVPAEEAALEEVDDTPRVLDVESQDTAATFDQLDELAGELLAEAEQLVGLTPEQIRAMGGQKGSQGQAGGVGSDAMLMAIAFRGMAIGMLAQHRANQQLLARGRIDAGIITGQSEHLRRLSAVNAELVGGALEGTIEAVGSAARAHAEAAIGKAEAALEIERAQLAAGRPPTQLEQGIQILDKALQVMAGAPVKVNVGKGAGPAAAPVKPAAGKVRVPTPTATAPPQPEATPGPATAEGGEQPGPAPAEALDQAADDAAPVEAEDQGEDQGEEVDQAAALARGLAMVKAGWVPPAMAAGRILESVPDPVERERILDLCRAMVAAGGEGAP